MTCRRSTSPCREKSCQHGAVTSESPFLTSKLRNFGPTIFAEMSALAISTGAINLGQGFPDADGPAEVLEAAVSAIRSGKGNQYPPGIGVPELRNAIADHQRAYYGIELDPDTQVLVTCGATEALAASFLSLLDSGDECILFEPFYDSYPAGVAMAGANVVPVLLRAPDFQPDLDQLEKVITARTRMIVVNSPHNPTGAVFSDITLSAIASLAIKYNLVVVSDEAYEHLTFDGVRHQPISLLPGMAERTISIGSAGKTLSVTGWKVGWATGPRDLVAAVRTSKQFLTYVSSGPFQYAAAVGLALDPLYFSSFAGELQVKRDRLIIGLDSAGFATFRPAGTYFVTTEISALTKQSGLEFCRSLPRQCGVVAIPNSVFYATPGAGQSFVRFAFCKKVEVIDEAVERLQTLVSR
jgi:N-succinyldiaminopimelate aminotransferase